MSLIELMKMREEPRMNAGLKSLCERVALFREVRRMVEIGSFAGESSIVFAEKFPEAEIICVDPHMPYEGDAAGTAEQMEAAYSAFNHVREIKPKIHHLRTTSSNAVDLVAEMDFVYIDGSHIWGDVWHDLSIWWPKSRGLLAGHDYTELIERLAPVKAAVDGFRRSKQAILELFEDDSFLLIDWKIAPHLVRH